MDQSGCKICVTGAAGYLGSSIVHKLLLKGFTVHATLRNLDDSIKVGLLKSFPNADTKLVLFTADIYNPDQFGRAIEGCDYVFHIATPLQHTQLSQYKNTTEAAIAGAKSIALSCIRSGTVKRLIYTASIVAASPMKDDGYGYKEVMDETCWTPLNLSSTYSNDHLEGYTVSKVLAEKEILSYGNKKHGDFEVVTLVCGLVGGDTLLSYTPASVGAWISLLTNSANHYQSLKYLEQLVGKIPIVHIDDVCEAHIFCIEKPSLDGRFLCASSYIASADAADYYSKQYPEFSVKPEYLIGEKVDITWGSKKLQEEGFKYMYDAKMTLDDCVKCARKMGDL